MPTASEDKLIELAKGGDRQAFGQLIRHHRQGVVNVVYRMCGDTHLAEDAAQEAFIKAWDKLPSYRPHSAFRNWVYRIATNVALDVLRREKKQVDLDTVSLASAAEGPEASLEKAERSDLIKQAVLQLPAASRAVLVLREYEGLAYKEIADALDIPIGTVMSRLSYGRNLLRKALAAYRETL